MRKIKILILLNLLILITGCAKDYVAVVNDQEISNTEFERNLRQLKEYYPGENETDLKKYLLEDMIIDAILLQEANKKNISISNNSINESYQDLVSQYENEETMLKDLKRYGFTKEQLLEDIKKQLTIKEYLSGIKDIDTHIEDLIIKSKIKIID